MHVTIVTVRVKAEHVEDFIAASKTNHAGSTKEEGNRRFDLLQDPLDPQSFVLYEAWDDDDGAKAHKLTAHYATWKDVVAPWMETPRQGKPWKVLAP